MQDDDRKQLNSEGRGDHLGNVLEKVIYRGENRKLWEEKTIVMFQSQVHMHTCCSSMYNHITLQDKWIEKPMQILVSDPCNMRCGRWKALVNDNWFYLG